MVMWKLKSCPRCGGDMFIGRDDNWFQQCLQCSYRCELRRIDTVKEPAAAGVTEENRVKRAA